MSITRADSAKNRERTENVGLVLPLIFVALYGSAFPAAKVGLSYAGVFEFLAIRYGLVAVVLSIVAVALGASWSRKPWDLLHIVVAGLLMIGIFNASAFASVALGVPPAVCALIVALQPIVVALGAGPLLGERVSGQQWVGLSFGVLGVYFVVSGGLLLDTSYIRGVALSLFALFALSAGNLYQKKFCAHMDVFTGGCLQNVASAAAMLVAMGVFGVHEVRWTTSFVMSLLWMTVVVSVGAVTILYVMIRRGKVSVVASIFYLVPVSAAIGAYLLFGQVPTSVQLLGAVVAAVGVAMVVQRPVGKRNRHQRFQRGP